MTSKSVSIDLSDWGSEYRTGTGTVPYDVTTYTVINIIINDDVVVKAARHSNVVFVVAS